MFTCISLQSILRLLLFLRRRILHSETKVIFIYYTLSCTVGMRRLCLGGLKTSKKWYYLF